MTYPRDGERKLQDTIKQLRAQVSRLRKENNMLRHELDNIMKPIRPRKENVEQKSPQKMTQEEWRLDFMKRFKALRDQKNE